MSKANEFNARLDNLMEKISKAVVDEEYALVVVLNEELCSAVVEMTEACPEEDKSTLYNIIASARDEIESLKDQIISKQSTLSSEQNKSEKAKAGYRAA
ncbi:MAG: hypothetical protein CBC47_04265 [Alphaproteobacteria bacterium TMED87]|nr:MAG: hypothetical protein CBC47_05610 [Alphaproteobacteria bacterium TMED87]OUV09926.1 MAG: hypothetical protein CBC47_04265 [Alphaproteobacteria bacterium TMED87]|tara:strand:+ start:678 stop:974 length:297 start_codon:yes stop_codon:yes gene_type:complete